MPNAISQANLPKIDLFCATGGASKEYHLFTVANADGTFTLFYSNGRIGDPMKPKVKEGPSSLDAVTKVFNRTAKEKLGASPPYTEAANGVAYSTTNDAGDMSGWLPPLLSEVLEEDAERYLCDDAWYAQEKMNGQRRGVLIQADEVRGANKKGRFIGGVPQAWVEVLRTVPQDTTLDGEHVGDILHVFDSPRIAGEDMAQRPYSYRKALMHSHLGPVGGSKVRLLFTATSEASKRELFAKLRDGRGAALGEGIVFRRANAPYTEGRAPSARHADCIKVKFYEFANCIVVRKNPGRSVALGLLDVHGALVEVGSCTIPMNQPIPGVNEVLRVRYMHMFEDGSLYGPPVSFGTSPDVDRTACTLAQVTRVMPKASAVPMDDDDYLADAEIADAELSEPIERERARA